MYLSNAYRATALIINYNNIDELKTLFMVDSHYELSYHIFISASAGRSRAFSISIPFHSDIFVFVWPLCNTNTHCERYIHIRIFQDVYKISIKLSHINFAQKVLNFNSMRHIAGPAYRLTKLYEFVARAFFILKMKKKNHIYELCMSLKRY